MKHPLLAAGLSLVLTLPLWAQNQGAEIVQAMEKKMYPNAKTEMVLKHTSNTGEVEEFKMVSYAKDNNQRIIVRFTAPARMIGNDLLMQDRNVWLFDAKAGREVKIPSNQSFGGTGFSYGDVLRLNFSDNYGSTVMETTDHDWTVELVAKMRDAPYYRVVLVVGKDYSPKKGSCYTRNGELLKEMAYTEVKDAGTGAKPLTVTVTSPLDPKDVSSLTLVKETKKDYPDNIFNKRNLSARLEEKL